MPYFYFIYPVIIKTFSITVYILSHWKSGWYILLFKISSHITEMYYGNKHLNVLSDLLINENLWFISGLGLSIMPVQRSQCAFNKFAWKDYFPYMEGYKMSYICGNTIPYIHFLITNSLCFPLGERTCLKGRDSLKTFHISQQAED